MTNSSIIRLHSPAVSANLPHFGDKTQAVWRRILLVPFDKVIEENLQIKNLAGELKKELPGILNWALAGLDRLNKQGGFTVPQGQKELLEDYRRDSDPARAFLFENYVESPDGESVKCSDLYGDYTEWCKNSGYQPMNERNFGKQVRRLFPKIQRRYLGTRDSREYVYEGLVRYVC